MVQSPSRRIASSSSSTAMSGEELRDALDAVRGRELAHDQPAGIEPAREVLELVVGVVALAGLGRVLQVRQPPHGVQAEPLPRRRSSRGALGGRRARWRTSSSQPASAITASASVSGASSSASDAAADTVGMRTETSKILSRKPSPNGRPGWSGGALEVVVHA